MAAVVILFCFARQVTRCHGYENIALNRPAAQSSTFYTTYRNTSAAEAVDGNTDQRFDGNSCARTNFNSVVWWRVDLQSVRSIYSIKVFYRNDSDENVNLRQAAHAGFSMYISNTTGPKEGFLCYKNNDTLPSLLSEHVCIQHGRYVTYYNERGNGVNVPPGSRPRETIVDLCEVQVYGCSHSGVYGEDCNIPCPVNCQEGNCHIVTGSCLGCIDGSEGQRCDESIKFRAVRCPVPYLGEMLNITNFKNEYLYEEEIYFHCESGFRLRGITNAVCGKTNRFNITVLPTCEEDSVTPRQYPVSSATIGASVGGCLALVLILFILAIYKRRKHFTKESNYEKTHVAVLEQHHYADINPQRESIQENESYCNI